MFAAAAIFSSCQKGNNTNYVQRNKVVILNQGNYTEQNASVSVYDEDTRDLTPNAYSKSNNGTKLGATLMSGTYSSAGAGYLLCSNPDKIESINIITMKSLGNAYSSGLENAREITIGGNYLFVTNAGFEYTDLGTGFYEYTNSFVSIYDISSYMPNYVTKIDVGSDAQGIICFENKVLVATKQGIVTIEKDGSDFVKGNVYADPVYTGAVKYLCAGTNNRIYASVPDAGGILVFDPYDEKVIDRYQMPLSYDGYITSDTNGYVYSYATKYAADWSVESSDVYKMDLSGNVSKVVTGENIYSVGVSSYSGNLFSSEANGFTSNSIMTVTNMHNDTQVATKTTGVGTFRYLFFSYLDVETAEPAE